MKGSRSKRSLQQQQAAVTVIRNVFGQHDALSQQSAKELSKSHRLKARDSIDSAAPAEDASLTYGEVTPAEFMKVISTYDQLSARFRADGATVKDKRTFVDLGSGRGLPSMCAAYSSVDFANVWGLEIIPELVDLSVQLRDQVLSEMTSGPKAPAVKATKVKAKAKQKALIDHIISHISSTSESRSIPLEALADALCRQLGHRGYRELLKGHKTLRRYLQAFPSLVQLSQDDMSVTLLEGAQESGAVPEEEESAPAPALIPRPPAAAAALVYIPSIQFDCADIFTTEWWLEADVVYAASLLFSDGLTRSLAEAVLRMRPDSWFICLKPLPLTEEEQRIVVLRHDSFFRMSWRMAKVYFYQLLSKTP